MEIITGYLSNDGQLTSGGPVFSFSVDVLQPRLIFDPLTNTVIFISQLDSSYTGLPPGKHALIMRSEPAARKSTGPRAANLVGYTSVKQSSINLHRDKSTKCLRVCYTHENDNGQTEPTCSTICNVGFNRWSFRPLNVPFCNCKQSTSNPSVIEYPVNGAVFAVWEETDPLRHRLHGYYVGTQNFVQVPSVSVQKHPLAVYRPSDGQVCVVWQHHPRAKTCSKLALRCYKLSQSCTDPCCCFRHQNTHCGKK